MLRPTKHSHPDKTVIYLATLLIKRLRDKRIEKYDDLLSHSKKRISGGDILFLPAVHFIFALGIIDYHQTTDSFEYIGA